MAEYHENVTYSQGWAICTSPSSSRPQLELRACETDYPLETLSHLVATTRCIKRTIPFPRAINTICDAGPIQAHAAACAATRHSWIRQRRRRRRRRPRDSERFWNGSRFTFVFQGAEVPCRAVRRRVISAAWAVEVAVTPPGARAPEARCRLSTTRARQHPPGRVRWSTIRIRTRRPTPIITRTRPGIIHRHRHRRHITRVTCRSTPGTRRTPTPDYSRKCCFSGIGRVAFASERLLRNGCI